MNRASSLLITTLGLAVSPAIAGCSEDPDARSLGESFPAIHADPGVVDDNVLTPPPPPPPSSVAQLALGDGHSCARTAAGSLYCWGEDNLMGTLGAGPKIVFSPTPLLVKGLSGSGALGGVVDVAAGYNHTCAILSSGKLACFGGNVAGQLGNGGFMPSSIPMLVKDPSGTKDLSGVEQVACGAYFTCAVTKSGAYCWGQGALGAGGLAGGPLPVQILDPSGEGPFQGAARIGAGESHACILKSDKTLFCFGENINGQLGTGVSSYDDTLLPTQVRAPSGKEGFLSGVDEIGSFGYSHSCARSGPTILCWGADNTGQIGAPVTGKCQYPCTSLPEIVQGISAPNGALALAVGEDHACARRADDTVVCWGSNQSNQLGAPVTSPCQSGSANPCSESPVAVLTAAGAPFKAAQIAAGSGDHTCAVGLDGGVWCWGKNTFGQLGDGTTATSSVPVEVEGL